MPKTGFSKNTFWAVHLAAYKHTRLRGHDSYRSLPAPILGSTLLPQPKRSELGVKPKLGKGRKDPHDGRPRQRPTLLQNPWDSTSTYVYQAVSQGEHERL
jgi:hypothetical protein